MRRALQLRQGNQAAPRREPTAAQSPASWVKAQDRCRAISCAGTGSLYIFASTHFFDEDIIANLAVIDRNAWVLIGTTDQLEHNPQMYAAWLNGLVYVNRLDADSRKESVKKMLRILNAGSSVLIFPEGGWNNSENLLVNPLFSGPWLLAKSDNCTLYTGRCVL